MSDTTGHKIKPHPFLPPEAQGFEPTGNPLEDAPSAPREERQFYHKHRRLFNLLLPLLLGLAAFKMVILTFGSYGLSWDEAYYYDPYVKAGRWLGAMVTAADKPIFRDAIDEYFEEINELPAVPKIVYGTTHALLARLFGPLTSVRLVSAAAFAALVVLIYLFTRQYFGPAAAIAAALLYMFTPRAFGHAHFAATESFTSLVYFIIVWLFVKGLGRRTRWSIAFAIMLGIGFATRVNCLILPMILFLWALLYYKNESVNNLYAALILSPIIMLLFWPWLWPDPLYRFADYLAFFMRHDVIATSYLGEIFNRTTGPPPWHYPFVMLGVTLPLGHLIFILAGLAMLARRMKRHAVGALVLIAIAIQLFIAAMPSSPKYDGIRLFFPVLPFLAIAGGVAFESLSGFSGLIARETPRTRFILVCCLLALSLAAAAWSMFTLPSALMYYNGLRPIIANRTENATLGFEISYWGEAFNKDMIEALNALPPGTKIRTLAMHPKVPTLLKRWGVLRPDLEFNGDPPYDYHVLQLRPSFYARPELTLVTRYKPIKTIDANGYPVMMLFQTGPQFEQLWPQYPDIP